MMRPGSDTPIGDSVERDMRSWRKRRRLLRRHRPDLEVADWDTWSGPLHADTTERAA